MGKSVNLGELGTMRISFGSEGVDDPKKFHTSLISGVRIVFTPSVELKDALTKIHFEHDGKRPGEDEGGNEGGGSGESGGEEGGSEGGEDEGGGFVDPNA
jgi:hypothetical protein